MIETSSAALIALTLVGAAYLLWLGISILSRPSEGASSAQAPVHVHLASAVGVVTRGAATSGLNPKALLLFLAVMPQFVDRHGGLPVTVQIAVLGAIHMTNCAVAYLALGTLARNTLVSRPTAAYAVTRASGVAMVILGLLLLIERAVASV